MAVYFDYLMKMVSFSEANKYTGIVSLLYDWQTMIGTVVTTVIAIISVIALVFQLKLQTEAMTSEKHKLNDLADLRDRQARISILMDLNKIGDFMTEAYKVWPAGGRVPMQLPNSSIAVLIQASESVDRTTFRTFHKLVSSAQRINARHLSGKYNTGFSRQFIEDLEELNYCVRKLFPYARLESEGAVEYEEPTNTEMFKHALSVYEPRHADTYSRPQEPSIEEITEKLKEIFGIAEHSSSLLSSADAYRGTRVTAP